MDQCTPTSSLSAAEQAHEQLFRSGAYLREFRPDDRSNPFARTYGRKRDAVMQLLGGGGLRVLDVGGGMGRMAVPLAARNRVTLCDLSPDMLRLARSGSSSVLEGLVVADARALPFCTGWFDAALCIDVLPHLPDAAPALAELRRVLRPGGLLLVDSTNSVPFWTLAYPRYLGRRPSRWLQIWRAGGVLPEWRTRVWHRRLAEFRRALEEAGFRIRSILRFGPPGCAKWHLAVAVAPRQ